MNQENKKTFNKNYLFLLIALVFFSFFVFDHIDKQTFWSDEAGVAILIQQPFSVFLKKAVVDGHPLAYAYSIKIWSLIFGSSELILKSFSIFFGFLNIVAIFLISKDFFKKVKSQILATFLTSTNYFLIWHSTQNKAYSFISFVSLLSFYFFTKIIQGKKNYRIFYFLLTVLGFYTHPWFILVFFSQVLTNFLFKIKDKRFKNNLLFQIFISVFSLPAILINFYRKNLGASSWIEKVNILAIPKSLSFLSFGNTFFIFFVSVVALLFYFNKKKIKERTYYFLVYLFFPLISAFLISQIAPCYVIGRYEMIVLPAFILLLTELWSSFNKKIILFLIIPLLLFLNYGNVVEKRNEISDYKTNNKMIMREIFNRTTEKDVVVATDLSWSTAYYYLNSFSQKEDKRINLLSFPEEIQTHPGWKNLDSMIKNQKDYKSEREEIVQKIRNAIDREGRAFILYKENEFNNLLYKELENNFNIKKEEVPTPHQPMWFDYVIVVDD